MSEVIVLRMGHRPFRDKRISTHVVLVARAFGADGIIFVEQKIKKVKESLEKINERWGGSFFIEGGKSWKETIKEWKSSGGIIAHLTMYGIPVNEEIPKIENDEDLLVVVGAEKVPGEVYELADFNVAVGNQPHSEVSALAVFLDRFFGGEELKKEFSNPERKIIPSDSGKEVKDFGD